MRMFVLPLPDTFLLPLFRWPSHRDSQIDIVRLMPSVRTSPFLLPQGATGALIAPMNSPLAPSLLLIYCFKNPLRCTTNWQFTLATTLNTICQSNFSHLRRCLRTLMSTNWLQRTAEHAIRQRNNTNLGRLPFSERSKPCQRVRSSRSRMDPWQ
jgi:hypothetical protein